MLTKLIAAVASLGFAALIAAPAAAQVDRSAGALVGHWTGMITEQGEVPQYTLSVHISLDMSGDPVGTVEYDAFPCAGVWTNSLWRGEFWSLEETITENTDRCAPQVLVKVEQRGANGLQVTLQPLGSDNPPATGMLVRR
jgi:hypothetical protein